MKINKQNLYLLGITIIFVIYEGIQCAECKTVSDTDDKEILREYGLFKRDMVDNKVKTPLALTRVVLKEMGNPETFYASVHVTGTNGKGSVVHKIAAVFKRAGYMVGTYMSPHIASFRERIQLNNEMISSEDAVKVHKSCRNAGKSVTKKNPKLGNWGYFGKSICMAFTYFAYKQVDLAIIEVGVGAKNDHTNVFTPNVSVITNVGSDHMDQLGNTSEEICLNKAHIIKQNIPVVVGENMPLQIVREFAAPLNAPVHVITPDSPKDTFFEINSKMASLLAKDFPGLKQEHIEGGLTENPPSRMELVPKEMLMKFDLVKLPEFVYMDVGHNEQAIKQVYKEIHNRHPKLKIRSVVSLSEGHAFNTTMELIILNSDYLHVMHGFHKKSMKIGKIFEIAKDKLEEFKGANILDTKLEDSVKDGDTKKTVRYALQQSSYNEESEVVLICGSFFMMAEVREVLGYEVPSDPIASGKTRKTKDKSTKSLHI